MIKTIHAKYFTGTPFFIECSPVSNGPGYWNSTKVSIFKNDILIGEYLRNYSSYGKDTFYPFEISNQWYALYSSNYTATRVMKLNEDSIEDWCGYDLDPNGFCPVEYIVPKYHTFKSSVKSHNGTIKEFEYYSVDIDVNDEQEFVDEANTGEFISTQYTDFAFMSGCVWGDDSCWKLAKIDLSKVPEKILTITEDLGYWQLPNNLPLKKCVNMSNWEPSHNWLELTRMEHVNIKTGEKH